MEIIKIHENNISEIIAALKNGAVLVSPTDTVYGLVCDATNEEAVKNIFEIKKRDKLKTLPVFVKDIKTAKKLAFIKKNHEKFLKDNKITVILKARKETLSKLVYKYGTIGIRIPKYKLLNLILEEFKNPLAQTSANISGKSDTTRINNVIEQFRDKDIIIIDAGNLPKNKPSVIMDLTKDIIKILRK
jgi:L-threonylcarbamoyladenylate synthase